MNMFAGKYPYAILTLMQQWLVRAAIGALALAILPAGLVLAATPKTTTPPAGAATSSPGQGLEISPPLLELSADPGQTVTANIRVRNVAKGDLIAKGRADDFGAGDAEDGKPKLLLEETGETRYSLKYWVQGVPDMRLAPGKDGQAKIAIKVPANAEPGGHFGVIRFTAVPPELEGTGVSLSASVGTLVLLRVSGQVTDKVSVAELSTGQMVSIGGGPVYEFKKGGFFEHGPVTFLVRLKNEGSVHEKVQGTIEVKDTFGQRVGAVSVNAKGGNVLPDSIRRFEETLDKKALFGRYTAKLNMSYLDGKQKVTAEKVFWVIPWKMVLLAIIGLVVLVWLLRLGIRRYNEHIIAQARRR